jgi:hypothetical protein
MDKQNADPEDARERHERFGRLPARTRPDATVEMVSTESPGSLPVSGITEDQRQALLAGG